MKLFLSFLLLVTFVSCGPTDPDPINTDPKPEYRCEEMTEANKVSGCKIGDWWNFDLERCNSTKERCRK